MMQYPMQQPMMPFPPGPPMMPQQLQPPMMPPPPPQPAMQQNMPQPAMQQPMPMAPPQSTMSWQAGQAIPDRKPILELNPEHPILVKLGKRFEDNPTDAKIADSAKLLLGQAILAEGGQLDDPSDFAERVNKLMTETL